MSAPEFEHPDVVLCPGGPMLLRGRRRTVQDAEGRVHVTTRPVSAVCRCQRSQDLPLHETVQLLGRLGGWDAARLP